MGLQIAARKTGNVTILDLQGRITIGNSNDALGAELRRLAETAPCDVLVNLAGVQQVDSSGISTLVRSFVTLERNAGSLKLLNPTGHVREVLELTRLIQSIPTYTDEAKGRRQLPRRRRHGLTQPHAISDFAKVCFEESKNKGGTSNRRSTRSSSDPPAPASQLPSKYRTRPARSPRQLPSKAHPSR